MMRRTASAVARTKARAWTLARTLSLSPAESPGVKTDTGADIGMAAAVRQLLAVPSDVGVDPVELRATAEQTRAVALAARGWSVFMRLPTGAGKSLAFQAPALAAASTGATLVVSPLVALIQDQVAGLASKGVRALRLTGGDRRGRGDAPLDEMLRGQRLVYTTPEFLMQNAEMRRWLARAAERGAVARLVLDEAHCVFEWGNAFRPAYLELARWRARRLPAVPVTLASASVAEDDVPRLAAVFGLQLVDEADAEVEAEAEGGLDAARVANASRMVLVERLEDRANLAIVVLRKPARAAALIAQRVGDAVAIVYCLTRKECEAVCLELARLGCRAGVYHGGMPRARREFVRKQWMLGRLSVICATSAFGMGIDRADVRVVVHHSLPLSLSAYMQQIGRAGRDGKPAECALLYAPEDKTRAEYVTTDRSDDGDTVRTSNGSSQADLADVVAFCELSRGECRKELLYSHFGTPFSREQCAGGCNCSVQVADTLPDDEFVEDVDSRLGSLRSVSDGTGATSPDAGPSKAAVEYYYQRVLAECRRRGLPKREALSRRVVKEVLDKQPASVEEMESMKGVGAERAQLYFDIFPADQ